MSEKSSEFSEFRRGGMTSITQAQALIRRIPSSAYAGWGGVRARSVRLPRRPA